MSFFNYISELGNEVGDFVGQAAEIADDIGTIQGVFEGGGTPPFVFEPSFGVPISQPQGGNAPIAPTPTEAQFDGFLLFLLVAAAFGAVAFFIFK